MSQTNKYKQLEALLSKTKSADPNPGARPASGEMDALRARVNELEAALAAKPEANTAADRLTAKRASQHLVGANEAKHPTEQAPQQGRNAVRLTGIFTVAALVATAIFAFLAIQNGAWQSYAVVVGFIGFFIAQFISARLARQNRVEQAGTLMIASVCYVVLVMTTFMYGVGQALSIALALAIIEIAFETLSGKTATRVRLSGLIFAAGMFLMDRFAPWSRPLIPAVQYSIPVIAASVVITIAFLMIGRVRLWNRALANISMGWKMALMVFVLVVGIAGVVAIGFRSLQRLQFHNSNLYEFMLIPIITLEDANVRLADTKFHIHVLDEELENLSSAEKAENIDTVQNSARGLRDALKRYESEWITTGNAEFTDLLRNEGRLNLQETEVNIFNETTASLDEYETVMRAFLASVESGQPSETLALEAENAVQKVINNTRKLIAVNEEFAKISSKAADGDYNGALVSGGITVAIALAAGLFISLLIVVSVTSRLSELTRSASALQQGDLNQEVSLTGRDEIGLLGSTFNRMANQLKELFSTMEQRVADRTHDLELATEVGRSVSEKMGNLDELLSQSVESIRSRYGLYYTQIYLMDDSGRSLVLRAGTGDAGLQLQRRDHRLAISASSLNSRAASTQKPVLVDDTQKSSSFLPNPLLPLTRSELAVPLIANNKVVGVLDMQSEKPETFSETNLPAFEVLASQLAIAIQNSALFNQAEEARLQVEEQARRLTASGWQEFMNGVDRSEHIGYLFDQKEIMPLAKDQTSGPENVLIVPIQVAGASVGEIRFTDEETRKWTESERQIVEATITRAAQHIENQRLLAQAQQYRAQAEQVSRRLTREGWDSYVQTRGQLAEGYAYDLNSVQQVTASNNGHKSSDLALPLTVRDEIIGQFTIDTKDSLSQEMNEIVVAVATQLGDQIERLRLSEQSEKRAYELATVATVSTTASTVLNPDELLQAVVNLTKERFDLYHAHIYLVDESWNTLLLAAGAGEVGRQMVAGGHFIQLDVEKSLVARAAREQQAIIVNDVRTEPDFLPNPLLPETRAEMAVPMIVGDKVLGVFDVQSINAGGFSTEDASIYTTLAAQVAVALQNARLYMEQSATVTQLRELDRLKSSFLANMSHELRTPLNSILGFADVMLEELDGPLTENMNNDLGLIQKNGQHLLHLINDVLDMAKIEAGRMNLNVEKFNLHSTIEEVIHITSPLASEKSLSLFIEKDSDQDVEIQADRIRLCQVMINLVNNATKFTEKGRVTIRTIREDDQVLISVKDTGIGIPPELLESVFQEFTQVDTTSTRKVGGTGLGLPISRRLIEMHSGRIWAESTGVEGEGATFHVSLPMEAKVVESETVTKN